MQSTGLMIFWLIAVLAMIPASLWLLKRSGMAGQSVGSQAGLKPVSQLVLGTGQKVITVELDAGGVRTWLVLGVTPQQITTLHTLPAPPDLASKGAAEGFGLAAGAGFAQQLRSLTERKAKAA